MAMVQFKKGLFNSLPAVKTEGTFYITTDEKAIWLDVSADERIRLGDFRAVADLAALNAIKNPSTEQLFYVTDLNVLARWNGAEYVQINLDTGATSVEVVGEGNVVTTSSYDPTTRKLTLTKGATMATKAELDELDEYVGEIPATYTETNIVDFIQKRASEVLAAAQGGSSETAASVKNALDEFEGEVATAMGTNVTGEGEEQVVTLKPVSESIDEKITALNLGQYATNEQLTTLEQRHDSEMDAIEGRATALEGKVDITGKVTEYVAAQIEAENLSQYATNDTVNALTDRVSTNEGDIATLKTLVGAGEDATPVADQIAAAVKVETDRASAAEKVNSDAIAAVKEDVDAFLAAAEVGDAAVDTLKEIQSYITTDGQAAAKMTEDIAANKTAIEAEVERAAETEGVLAGRLDALEAIDHDAYKGADETVLATAQEYADGLNTAMDTRVKVLEAIDHEAYKAYADQAETDAVDAAKAYADGLAGNYDSKGSAAQALTDAKAYTDGQLENYSTTTEVGTAIDSKIAALKLGETYDQIGAADAALEAANEYSDGLNTAMDNRVKVLEAIDHNAYVAADEVVLGEAKSYADGLAGNYDAKGAAATAETNSKAYTDQLFTWGSF